MLGGKSLLVDLEPPWGTPKSSNLGKIAKILVSKFDDFSGCLLEALPEGFGTPKSLPKHEH